MTSVDQKVLGKIISPEQSKTKENDFVTRVANKKQRLRSSQQLSWSLRTGSTSSFNRDLRMTLESLIEDVDELLRRRGG